MLAEMTSLRLSKGVVQWSNLESSVKRLADKKYLIFRDNGQMDVSARQEGTLALVNCGAAANLH